MRRYGAIILIALVTAEPSFAQGMTFGIATSQEQQLDEITEQGSLNIYADGQIQNGDADRFVAFVRNHKLEEARVVFNSAGGALLEGVKLGRAIRGLKFNTDIGVARNRVGGPHEAICASACAYAFAGGVLRFISSDGGKLGLHQFRTASGPGISEGDAQTVSGLLVAYLAEMGIDPNAFALAAVTSPDGIVWLAEAEAETLGFINNGVLPTTADVKIAEMHPYLRLNQQQPGVELRVLVLCDNHQPDLEAGIITNPEQSRDLPDWTKRSYLEFDGKEELALPGSTGIKARDSAVWLTRKLNRDDTQALLHANALGIWLDGFGMVRIGGKMDLRKVAPALKGYIDQCLAS